MSETSFRRAMRDGRVQGQKGEGGAYMFARADLEALRGAHGAAPGNGKALPSPELPEGATAAAPALSLSTREGAEDGKARPTTAGQVVKDVFARLNRGEAPEKIVEELGIEPAVVWKLLQERAVMVGALVVPVPVRKQIERLVGGTFTADGLAQIVAGLMRDRAALRQFTYPCYCCGEPTQATAGNEWKDLRDAGHLAAWCCAKCVAKK